MTPESPWYGPLFLLFVLAFVTAGAWMPALLGGLP